MLRAPARYPSSVAAGRRTCTLQEPLGRSGILHPGSKSSLSIHSRTVEEVDSRI